MLSGSAPLSNWTNQGNNRWQTTCSACNGRITGLYRSNNALPLGRYPNRSDANKGYLTIQSHQNNTQITSQQGIGLNFNTGWTGTEVVIRATQWVTDRYGFTGQSGSSLNLTSPNSGYGIQDGWGYFVQNHPATLDQEGEWAFDSNTKTIQLYSATGDPNNQFITATTVDRAVDLSNVSNITVRNLSVIQALNANLYINASSNLTFSSLDVLNAGEDGVFMTGSGQNVVIENSTIQYVNNNGVSITPYQNVTFRNSILRHVGIDAGRSRSGDGQGNGLQTAVGQTMVIENNVIDSIGYNGISFTNSTTIRKNVISNFCMTKSDGGGIYTWNGNRNSRSDIRILSNIIFNGLGAPEGTPGSTYSGANGIFFDDCSQGAEITGNTVFKCAGLGIFLNATSNLTISGNTIYNNGESQLTLTDNRGHCVARNNSIQNNILTSRVPGQLVAKYRSNANDLNQYGPFNYNYYMRPFDDVFKIQAVHVVNNNTSVANLALAQWQTQFGQDANSQNSPITYAANTLTPTGNVLRNNVFTNDNNGWSTWSPHGNGRADWDNSNRIDGGTLRVSFANASNQPNSYVLVTVPIGSVARNKTYQLDFDAIGTSAKRIDAFIRQQSGSYSDLAPRFSILTGTNRQHFTTAFTATADEANAIMVFQVYEDGQTAWLDNVKLQEATATPNNPDDFIRLAYNPTAQNTSVGLSGDWRDAKNQAYSGTVTLAPFTSLLLLKVVGNTPPPPPPPVTELRAPENPANAVNGLDYTYYEGNWGNLPDFGTLNTIETGTVGNPDLSVRNRDQQYAVQYKGYVNVPTDGNYTFYTNSDDGSKLYIGTTEVVNNDGGHPMIEKSGTIGLKAGTHALTVSFFQGSGGQGLQVSYEGPNIGKQIIPATAYYRVPSTGGGTGTGTGLRGEYFNNTSLTAPILLTRTDATVNFDWGTNSPAAGTINADNFSIRWTGQVEAPVSGNYTFSTNTDDGVRLWVNGVQLINDWNGHPPITNNGTSIALTAGQKYTIRMEYFDGAVGAVARLLWAYPGQNGQIIPQNRLYPATTASARIAAVDSEFFNPDWSVQVYPIPARDEIQVRYYAEAAGPATVRVINTAGQEVVQLFHQATQGENNVKIPVRNLARGSYVLSLTQDSQRITRKIILSE